MADAPAAVVAIDGGNSKTDVAIVGWDGTVLAALRGPGASQERHGVDGAVQRLSKLVRAAAEKAGLDGSGVIASHASACLAGADLPEEEAALTAALTGAGWARTAVAMNDTFAVLRGGVDEPWGVAVVCGAGINCVAVAPSGDVARYLALGELTGDWGGGYGLAMAVLWHAMRGWDGRGPATALGPAAAECFGYASIRDVAVAVHKDELDEADLHRLAVVLLRVAADGDPVARSLVTRQAAEIAAMAAGAMRQLGLASEGVPVVLGGGVLESRDPLLLAEVDRQLAQVVPGVSPRVLDVPPIVGAALLGLDQVGASSGPKLRLRASYRNAASLARQNRPPRPLPCDEHRRFGRVDDRRRIPPLAGAAATGSLSRRERPPHKTGRDGAPASESAGSTRLGGAHHACQESAALRCPTNNQAKLGRHRVASSELCIPVCRPGAFRHWAARVPARIEARMYRGTEARQLPAEPNSFIGRERETDALRALVRTTRMVTLTGPGGIGKTRLALHALAAMAEEFSDGASYVELADVTSPDLVVARVASVIGVAEEKGRPLPETLADALRPRAMVLALDNCEHLLDACAPLCQLLLSAAPELRLVVTSREPLRMAGETVWEVPPLAVTSADGSAAEAVQLFRERAAAIAPGFALTPGNAGAVAEICRALDGIPLAIELAAARVRALSVEQIRLRVADPFALLTRGDRAAAPRQRTLRAAIDWSHDLLTPSEQALLRRLSVFAGWSLEMAGAVCTDELVPAAGVLDTVAALVDKSLVVRAPEALGQARYRMLDTIREYAAQKLAQAGEAAETQHRFRDHTLAVAERNFAVGMALVPAPWQDRVDVFRRYDVDAGNVWLVLGACLAEGDVASGLRICTAIRPCMLVRGEFALGCELVDAFLARPEAADVAERIRGQALIGRAQLSLPGDPAGAEPAARAGLDLCRKAGDEFWTAAGLNLLSEIAVHTGRPDEAEALGQEATAIAGAAADGWNLGWALGIRSAIAAVRGDLTTAAELAGASLEVMRSLDHRWGLARVQLGIGDLARMSGDLDRAREMYSSALGYLREIDARPEIARCLSGLGRLALDLGDVASARDHLAESLRLSRDIGSHIGLARGLEASAGLFAREGDAERAVLLAAASARQRAAPGPPPPPGASAERYLAAVRRADDGVAERLWERGLALAVNDAIELATRPAPPVPGQRNPAPAAGGLTPRELEIASLIASGLSNKAIGGELVISPATVARHVANIMSKLGFRSRAQIAVWVIGRR